MILYDKMPYRLAIVKSLRADLRQRFWQAEEFHLPAKPKRLVPDGANAFSKRDETQFFAVRESLNGNAFERTGNLEDGQLAAMRKGALPHLFHSFR